MSPRRVLALRVDVCTRIGAEEGVPRLLDLFGRAGVRATFFVTLGPETGSRALLQIWRPTFFLKCVRTRALESYGVRTLLRGTLLPPTEVGASTSGLLRAISDECHEAGLHGWDHFGWMDEVRGMEAHAVVQALERAAGAHRATFGAAPLARAAPGWRITEGALLAQERFRFAYASDTRGSSPFFPLVHGAQLATLQLPTTLPTLDELMGRVRRINDRLFGLLAPGLNVHTIHAEVEGRRAFSLFEDFLGRLARARVEVITLREAAEVCLDDPGVIPKHPVTTGRVRGRSGWVACQERVNGS